MPSVSVDKIELMALIGKQIDDAALESTVFDFGVELDDIYEERGRIMYKFDVPANRYDLLCIEGFSRALRAYMGVEPYQDLKVVGMERDLVTVRKHQTHERSHIACAIIKGIEFTDSSYNRFIDYQDKLHCSIGRNRSLVAIGTHDLSKIDGKIEYSSINLKDINFVPLANKSEKAAINGADLEEHFRNDRKISKFFSLLSDKSKAVAFTCNGEVMSIPPIINSEKTKISKETRDVFIDVTGTDFNKVNTALKLILYNFRGREVHPVKILDAGGQTAVVTPVFSNYTYTITPERVFKKLHLDLGTTQIQGLLERMAYKASIRDGNVVVDVPDVRSDVMHECDIMEDIAVSYGFNNFEKRVPSICTVGHEEPLNKFSDKVRLELALSGYNEVLTLTLLSRQENFVDPKSAVVLSNPKSREYEVVRTSLLPGILKSISSNLHAKIPVKVFEVADVVLLSDATEEGARNERRACAVIASHRSLLEDVQGPLSLVLEKCGFRFEYVALENDISSYSSEEYEAISSTYLENQGAFVKVDGEVVGTIGVLHPGICHKFGIPYAASSFEINVDSLFNRFITKK